MGIISAPVRLYDGRHIKSFAGVRADSRGVTGATSITSGTTALTVAGANFTAADAGKLIIVPGAGAAGAVLVSTIAAVVSATQVTLADAAGATLSAVSTTVAWATDDRAAVQAAINGGDYTLDFSDTTVWIGSPGLVVDDANAIAPATRVSRSWVAIGNRTAMQGEGVTTWTAAVGRRGQQSRFVFTQNSGVCVDVIGQGFSAQGIWIDQNPADGSIGVRLSRPDTFEDIDTVFRFCRFRNGNSSINVIGRGLFVQNCGFEGMNVAIDLAFPNEVNADTSFGQNYEAAWRSVYISNNRFHSVDQVCIRNTGANAASIVGLQVADNHADGGSLFRFWNGNVGRGSQFSGNRITNLIAGGSGMLITGGRSVTINDCHFASHVDTSAVETDWSNEAISFSGTITGFVSIANCSFRRFQFRALNFSNNMLQVQLKDLVMEDVIGTTNGTRSPILFSGTVTDLDVSGISHFQQTGASYADNILSISGTLSRGFGSGWVYSPFRHRAHNNTSFVLSRPGNVVSTATDYTTTAADGLIRVTSTAAARTITLTTTRVEPNFIITIKDASGGAAANNITIAAAALIDGAASIVINTNHGSRTIRYTGTTFEVI